MQNSQTSSDTSNPTVAKLLEVDAELATQEVELSAQLQSIQEKRHSLRTVIDLFAPTDTATATEIATPLQIPAAPEQTEVVDTPKRQAKKNSSPASKKQNAKSLPKKKTSSEQETWQQYLRDEFSNATLSQAVSEVMQQHSGQVLEIAAVVDAIFVDAIPQEVRTKARERVSNVLSVGVKKEKWYRGEAGSYSMLKAAV